MSFIGILGGIFGVIGKVAGVAGSIFKIARPLLEALRPAVDEVDEAMQWLEENAAKVGEDADAFLDKNAQTLMDLELASARGAVVFGKINQLTAAMRVASQERTPDTITEQEAAEFIGLIGEIREALGPWRNELDAAVSSMKKAEAMM